MTQKRIAPLMVFALLLAMAISACATATPAATEVPAKTEVATEAPATEVATEAPTETAPAGVTFGMVLVGPKNDHGWSQAHYEAGQYVEANLPGSKMIVFEGLNSADHPEATLASVVDDMIKQGATLILTTSDAFQDDTLTVAQNNPDVTFINVSGDHAWSEGPNAGKAPANEGNIMGRMEYTKAIAGCAAALTTETGQIGYLGPLVNFETRRLASSAYLGAKHCWETYRGKDAADLKFNVVWIGFWFNIPGVTQDPTEVTNQFYDQGADVVISGIDTTEAVVVAGQRAGENEAVYAIPYDFVGACEEAPEVCLGVPYFNWGPAYLKTAQTVQDGTWKQSFDWNGPDWADMNNKDTTAVGWVNGAALKDTANLDDFIAKLASGEVNVWTGPIKLQSGKEYVADGQAATDPEIWFLPELLEGMIGSSE